MPNLTLILISLGWGSHFPLFYSLLLAPELFAGRNGKFLNGVDR